MEPIFVAAAVSAMPMIGNVTYVSVRSRMSRTRPWLAPASVLTRLDPQRLAASLAGLDEDERERQLSEMGRGVAQAVRAAMRTEMSQ
jgi:hypothetical protein